MLLFVSFKRSPWRGSRGVRVSFCFLFCHILEMGVLFNLTEMGLLNYFEVMWSKVLFYLSCLSMVGHFHFQLISIRKDHVGSWKFLFIWGSLVILLALRG